MPTYDYLCAGCGHELEIFQSMSESPKRKCPKCGKLKLERQIGMGAAVIFKGSGFYETDYRSESYKKGAQDEKKGKSDAKSESKKKDAKTKDNKSKDAGPSKKSDS
jgi:putative FmdB family regulatory protein